MPKRIPTFRSLLTALLVGIVLVPTSTDCVAASSNSSLADLTRIWREEFPVPQYSVPNIGMAPPLLGTGGTANISHSFQRPIHSPLRSNQPHPAVARIIVPEKEATSYGSGTLIDVRDKFGMVITNWHVVRDATGTIEVVFPDGFTSKARALKVDEDWDLAALVIWQPRVEPVRIASAAPRPGEDLTICGYGQGNYRCQTGRCTQYYAPRQDFPQHVVELDVEARQGDSGGPIFNRQGELAGVLFGAGQGTTLGSFGGRVGAFLATLAPDIGRATESLAANVESSQNELAVSQNTGPPRKDPFSNDLKTPSAVLQPHQPVVENDSAQPSQQSTQLAGMWPAAEGDGSAPWGNEYQNTATLPAQQIGRDNLFEQMKTVLAAVGLLTIVVQMLRVAR